MLLAQEQALKELELEMDQLAEISEDAENIDLDAFKTTLGVKREDTIRVSGLPYHYQESELRLLFKDCGGIKRVAIPEDRVTKL